MESSTQYVLNASNQVIFSSEGVGANCFAKDLEETSRIYIDDDGAHYDRDPPKRKIVMAGPTHPLLPKRTVSLKAMKFDDEPLKLACEWQNCSFKCDDMSALMHHVANHVPSILTEPNDNEDEPGLNFKIFLCCNWRKCPWKTDKEYCPEFQRHLYLHAYHTKLKCIGRNTIMRSNLNPCTADAGEENVLPDLADNLLCAWDTCSERFLNIQIYYDHIRMHCENNPKGKNVPNGIRCQWSGCSFSFPNITKLRDHMRSHTQEKLLACPTCGAMFSNRTRFFDHCTRQVLLDEQSFACSVCMKCFSTARLLRDHIRSHVNSYKCNKCEMSCATPSALNSHMKFRHSVDRPYECANCQFAAKTIADLNRHQKKHINWKLCCEEPGCDYSCRAVTSLTHHYETVHSTTNSRYICHICQKKFRKGYYLTRHLISRHKLQWPSGHSRFRYKLNEDGFFRLLTVRYESLDIAASSADTTTSIEVGTPGTIKIESV